MTPAPTSGERSAVRRIRLHRCPQCSQVRDTTTDAPHSIFTCDGWEDEPHEPARMLPEAWIYEGPTEDTDAGRWDR